MPYPLFELATLLRVRRHGATNDSSHVIDKHRSRTVHVKLCAFKELKTKPVTIMVLMCDNGYLLLRYSVYGQVPIVKQVQWFQHPSKQMVCMSFDPNGDWLVCACQDNSVCVLPVAAIFNKAIDYKPNWSTTDITIIEPTNRRAPPTSIVWWHSIDKKDIAIIGTELGELVFIDLGLHHDVAVTDVKEKVANLELAQNDKSSVTYLLIHTVSGEQWRLLLELSPTQWSPDSDVSQMGFEMLEGRTVPFETFLQSDEFRRDFAPVPFKQFSNYVRLNVQHAKGRNYVAAHDKETSIYKVFDASVDNWLPLFVYQVPADSDHIVLTDRLMFAVINHMDKVCLSVISNQMSETSSPTVDEETSMDAVVQLFSIPDDENILEIYKERFPSRYLADRQKRHKVTEGDGGSRRGLASSTAEYIESQKDTVLDGCIVVTDAAVYQCRPRVSPEKLFLQLAVEYSDCSLADQLGIVLSLDVNTLYETGAKLRLSRGEYNQAMKLFNLSKCDNMTRISSFAKYGRMKEILTHLRLVLNRPAELLPTERKELSNLAVQCYIQQIVESKDRHLEMTFRQFLTDSFDYNVLLALNLLAEHGMYEILMDIAKSRGHVGDALDLIISKGTLQLGIDSTTRAMSQEFSVAMATSTGTLLQCLTSADLVYHLLNEPEYTNKYLTAMKSCLRELDVETVLRLAELFDPSRPSMKMHLQKAAIQSRRRSSSLCSITSTFSSFSTSSSEPGSHVHDINQLRLETLVEFFLEVLLVLNYKRQVIRRIHAGSFAGYQEDTSLTSPPQSPLSSPRRASRVAKQSTLLSCGQYHAAAVCHGDLYTWGKAHSGRLGHGEIIVDEGKVTPFRVETLHMHRIKVLSVACGREHTLALCQQGVYGWGSSKYGQVGIGSSHTQTRPVEITELSNHKIAAIACGQYHSLALCQDHRVWSWGWGVHGQLGHGDPYDQPIPKIVQALADSQVTQISAGCCHSVVLTLEGQVMTFGCNRFGQLGDGEIEKQSLPTVVMALKDYKVVMVSSGLFHNVAVTTGPQLIYVWGSHPASLRQKLLQSRRRRGSHSPVKPQAYETVHLTPRPIDNNIINRIKQVACGSNHTLIVTVAGEMFSIGKNDCGQLGVGTYRVEQFVPTLVQHFSEKPVIAVAAGVEFSAIIDIAGHTWVWGRADHGQLGLESIGGGRGGMSGNIQTHHHHPGRKGGQFLGKDVLIPTQLPGLPLVITTGGLSINPMDDLMDDDTLSDDLSDSELEISLPELSRMGPQSVPYSRHCISLVLQNLPSHYSHTVMLRLCLDYKDWQGVADIYEMDRKFIYSMVYRLRVLKHKDWKTEMIVDKAKTVIHSCLRILSDEKSGNTVTVTNMDLAFLLHQMLWFWYSMALPMQPLEVILSEYLKLLAYPLSLMLFSANSAEMVYVAPENSADIEIILLTDREDVTLPTSAKSLLEIPDKIRQSFSTKFCLEVTSAVVTHITSGQPHKEYSDIMINGFAGDKTQLQQGLQHQPNDVPEEKLWQEILQNLKKDLNSREFIQLSHNDAQALLKALKEQIQSNTYRYVPEEQEPDIMVFSCGHHFLKQPFLLTTVPLFETAMNNLPVPLPATADIMVHLYRMNGCVPLACPNCVLSALKQLESG
ncbi:uncharacterized protein LOC144437691 [Glandiceps talaboti]